MARSSSASLTLLLAAITAAAQAPSPAPAGLVQGVGNFTHIVENMDRSLAFYRDALGLEPNNIRADFSSNPGITRMLGAPGVESKVSTLKIPGSVMGVELIEYRGVERKPVHPHFYDPGAANLILRVRDLDSVVERLKKINTKILTAAGAPVVINNTAHVIFVQDPDGFVVELGQAPPQAQTTAPAGSNIIGAAFEVSIEDTEKSVALYRDALGFPMTAGASFNDNKLMAATAGAPGAQFRQSRSSIPGTSFPMTLIEFKDIDRKPLHTRVTDPGTALLQLRVRDADEAAMKLKAAGAMVVSEGGHAAEIGPGLKIALVRDLNNLFLELIARAQ